MIFFSLLVAAYVLLLVLIKLAPSSLKAAPKGWLDHVVSIKVSLLLGVAVLTIFLLVSNFSFDTVDNAT